MAVRAVAWRRQRRQLSEMHASAIANNTTHSFSFIICACPSSLTLTTTPSSSSSSSFSAHFLPFSHNQLSFSLFGLFCFSLWYSLSYIHLHTLTFSNYITLLLIFSTVSLLFEYMIGQLFIQYKRMHDWQVYQIYL